MKENQRLEPNAGSLTPQLEGAARSASHPQRTRPQASSKPEKGGAGHE